MWTLTGWRCLHWPPPPLWSEVFSHQCLEHFDSLLFLRINTLVWKRKGFVTQLYAIQLQALRRWRGAGTNPVCPSMVAWWRGPRPWASCWFTLAAFWSRNSQVTSEPWNVEVTVDYIQVAKYIKAQQHFKCSQKQNAQLHLFLVFSVFLLKLKILCLVFSQIISWHLKWARFAYLPIFTKMLLKIDFYLVISRLSTCSWGFNKCPN